MKKYAKYVNPNEIIEASSRLEFNGLIYYNPKESVLLEAGYLPLVYDERPETENISYSAVYKLNKKSIRVSWVENEDETKVLEALEKSRREDELRELRKPLLDAFDIYKTNLFYGIETESEGERNVTLIWYSKILDLDEETILGNAPAKITKYIK